MRWKRSFDWSESIRLNLEKGQLGEKRAIPMTSPRRSLSASFGSWAVQLVYNPRLSKSGLESENDAARVRESNDQSALWPAFFAMLIAVGAACYALAHFIALPSATRVLAVTLLSVFGIAWGARCGVPALRRICGAARWPAAFVLAVCALSLRWSESFAPLLDGQPNMQAAVFCGFITLLSVLLIGARSGGRLVPVSAPLVPALSLLGLLCLVAVDGLTQFCFLLFSAAALYLLCYDRFLRRAAPDLSSGVWSATRRAQKMARGDAPAWALQSVLVSSVWFALFLGGGALLFWPLQKVLPDIAAQRWERGQGDNGSRKFDYSGGASVMELRGGTHALSPRVLLRVTPIRGVPTGLWRGRVYERYERSLWSESDEIRSLVEGVAKPMRLVQPRPLGPLRAQLPQLAPRAGRIEIIDELVVPLGGVSNTIYSSGLPFDWEPRDGEFDSQDPARTKDLMRSQSPYWVSSFSTQPNLRILDETPGFDPAAENSEMAPELRENLKFNLELPTEETTRSVLKAVVAQMKLGPGSTLNPSQKVRAISKYLRDNCLYSLQAPTVPPTSDATAFFLSESRVGACDMFASSMALLLREAGVPARVTTGFLDPMSPDSLAESPNGRSVKILRERDAHAWVEYYVPSFGWLSVDPTQNTRELPPTIAGQLAEIVNLFKLELPPILLILPLMGVGLIVVGTLWQRRGSESSPAGSQRQRIENAYNTAIKILRRRVPYALHMSPAEYETRVTQSHLPLAAKQEFSALTHLYLAARYGPISSSSGVGVDECLARLKAALKRGAKK